MHTDIPEDGATTPESLLNTTETLAESAKGGSRSFWRDVGLLARMARAVYADRYELATPKIFVMISTLGYVISPVDAIPDVIPMLGLTDDVALVLGTVSMLSYELVQFREWEAAQAA